MDAERFHQLPIRDLSAWLRAHPDAWWTVDGDPILTGRLSFPCPSEKLAAALDRRTGAVLVGDPESKLTGPRISSGDLDTLAGEPRDGRALQVRWPEGGTEWLLVEDREVAQLSRSNASGERP